MGPATGTTLGASVACRMCQSTRTQRKATASWTVQTLGFSPAPVTCLSQGPGQWGAWTSLRGSGPMQDPPTALNPASLQSPGLWLLAKVMPPGLWWRSGVWPLTTNRSKVHILHQVQLRLALHRWHPPVPGLGGGLLQPDHLLNSQLHMAHLQGGGELPAPLEPTCCLSTTILYLKYPRRSTPPPWMTTAATPWRGTCPAWSSKSGSSRAVFTCWRRADSSTLRGWPAFWSK